MTQPFPTTLWNERLEVEARALEGASESSEFAVTIIRPGLSKNGLLYAPAVLAAAVSKFEGVAAFADHPTVIDDSRAGGRSLRDLVGVFHSARADEAGAVRATLRLLPAARWAAELVSTYIADREAGRPVPPIGISADLLVTRRPLADGPAKGRPRYEVVAVEAVNSVDLVYRPSAGGTFDRILNNEESHVSEETTVAEAVAEAVPTREALCAELLAAKLAASNLPPSAQARLRERFAGGTFAVAALEGEIESMRELLGAVARERESSPPVRGAGSLRAQAQVGRTSLEQFTTALELLFGVEVPESCRNVQRLSGIREAYLLLTGDYDFSGRPDPERAVVREANETLLAQMDSVVASVMNKRLVQDYKAQPKWWAPLVSVVDLRDMRQQTRVLLNDFGALATVAENAAYANVAWGDTEETYTVGKRGNLVYVSMEAIVNDDVRAFTRLPRKLAAAATVTINEFVSALWTVNAGTGPAMKDGVNVFAAGRGNLVAVALDAANLAAGITAVTKYANSAAKRIGIRPRYLLVPPDLEWTAHTLTHSTLLPGTANNDVNYLRGIVEPVVVPNWTDVNNWYLHADPATVEGIELGFLNGRQAPEILVQDDPRNGYPFTNDAIVWKVRWIFGGGWLDWRAAYGSVLA